MKNFKVLTAHIFLSVLISIFTGGFFILVPIICFVGSFAATSISAFIVSKSISFEEKQRSFVITFSFIASLVVLGITWLGSDHTFEFYTYTLTGVGGYLAAYLFATLLLLKPKKSEQITTLPTVQP